MKKCIKLTKYFRSHPSHVFVNGFVSGQKAPREGGRGPPAGRGEAHTRPLPFPADVGFDTCAVSSKIDRLYILHAHMDHIGIPPEGCSVYAPKGVLGVLQNYYDRFSIKANIYPLQAELVELEHSFWRSAFPRYVRSALARERALSFAAVLHRERIILADECDDPRNVFERFKETHEGYTIAIMRTPYPHSPASYLNNPYAVFPHWLADNKREKQYAPNVLPKALPSLLDLVGQL